MSCINDDVDTATKENMYPCKEKALHACLSLSFSVMVKIHLVIHLSFNFSINIGLHIIFIWSIL